MRYLRTFWHLGLAAVAIVEYGMAETNTRKLLCGGAAGYHLAAAHIDWASK